MPHISRGVEYALHCLLHLTDSEDPHAPSALELAEFQGVPKAFVAKLFTRLEKAGLVRSAMGAHGGFSLARPPREISVLDVVEAVDGSKPLFQCTEVRRNCVLFADGAPPAAVSGVCAIHQVMLDADKAMRAELANRTLHDIGSTVARKIPVRHLVEGRDWFHARAVERTAGRTGGKRS
ncbi:MAG: Rrf2 family transcriptional regulator [Pseudomonadales bacterium]